MFPVEESTARSNVFVVAAAPHEKTVATDGPGPISVGGHDHSDAAMSGAEYVTMALSPWVTEPISGVPKVGLVVKLIGTVDAAAISRSVENGGTTNCGMVASWATSSGRVPEVLVALVSDSTLSWSRRGSTE